jgi:hypothetical protein
VIAPFEIAGRIIAKMDRRDGARLVIAVMLANCVVLPPLRAADDDACSVQLPSSLARTIEEHVPGWRLPRQEDSRSRCVADRQREHRSPCLLVARGDFDGDGQEDIAVLLPNRRSEGPPKLVVALARTKSWQLEELGVGTDHFVNHFVIETLPPGTYRETEAITREGQRPAVTSSSDGVMMSACDTWSNGYFRVNGKWLAIRLSD